MKAAKSFYVKGETGELRRGQFSGSAESIVPQFVFKCVCVLHAVDPA